VPAVEMVKLPAIKMVMTGGFTMFYLIFWWFYWTFIMTPITGNGKN
jgi:hypothetical protein